MALPDWVKTVLAGGIPALVDYGDQAPEGANNTTPEKSPPVDNTGRDNANGPANFLSNFGTDQAVQIGIVVGSLALLYVLAKKL